jgi:Tol biopolymer transport system component
MRRLALALAAFAAIAAIPAAAGAAVLPGPNGPIVFTSGRGGAAGNDDNAKIWFVFSDLGGGATQLTTGSTRHSHPAWSPDRTKIAYSRSVSGAGARDIYVRDLRTGFELQLTDTPTEDEDRAAWSPDGSEIAYGHAAAVGSQRDIFISPSTGGAPRFLAISSVADEDRPVWSPDGKFIYYARDTVPSTNADIVKERADNSSPNPTEVVATGANEWQPSLSPDGAKLCYSRGRMADSGPDGVDVYTADADGLNSGIQGFATSTIRGEYNCAWSPDGTKILHVRGVFSNGELVVAPYPGPGSTDVVEDAPSHFDGNPDWTRNPPPRCSSKFVNVGFNGFVRIPLSCTDAQDPPFFQNDPLELEISRRPQHGTLGGIDPDDGSVIYTPDANYRGADSFRYTANDGKTTSRPATVRIGVGVDVTPPRISRVRIFPRRWERGRKLPKASARVGMRIRWRLSERAKVTLTFQRKRGARFKSVRPPVRVRHAHTGRNTVRFQGRLNRRKRLRLGTYRVVLRAVDPAGNRSSARRTKTFRIVAG